MLIGTGQGWTIGRTGIGALGRVLVRLVLPPRCPGCGVPVEDDHRFCATCWSSLHFLGPPWCAGCNTPFEFYRGEGALCAPCLKAPPAHAGVRAAVAYGPVARTLALRLKYGRRMGFAVTAARSMARLMPTDAELLLPVPLHRWRLWSRGFNQAWLIARALSDHTAPMRGIGGRRRARAVRAAFAVPGRAAVAGRAIVLVDDVHTSGATADACVRALLAAGAASVTVLCWARVLPDD